MIYLTGDHHFGHDQIIKYENRPFYNSREMDRKLIKYYNEIVNDDDIVYFLGDFSLKNSTYKDYYYNILKRMEGTKILILGNHDSLKPFDYVDLGFQSVHTALSIIYNDKMFILVHDPAVSIVNKSVTFLHAHIHSLFKQIKNCINVGVDVWNYKPVSIEEIIKEIGETRNEN